MSNDQFSPPSAPAPLLVIDERREPMLAMMALIQQIHANQLSLDRKLTRHMTEETDELAKAITKLMAEAFPEGDPTGHRAFHEASIKKAEEQAEFWKEMRIAAGKWVGLGILGFLAGAVVLSIKTKLGL